MVRKSNAQKEAEAKELQELMQRSQVPDPEPGNETSPKPKVGRVFGRAWAEDLPGVDGPGVAPVKVKKLDVLGEKFITARDDKALLAEEMTAIEKNMAEVMAENNITRYRFSDQEMFLKPGKTHVKIKTVKSEGSDSE